MPPLPWPPSSTYLLSKQKDIPPLLLIFTKALLSSKRNSTFRSERLTHSICHDICYNLTNGQWKTPKHLLLGMSLRLITGSSKVVTFLNCLGHCVSRSTLLELETAMCDSVKENISNLRTGAAKQAVITNFCWDNFDILEETPSGLGTMHSTHGIIIQETLENSDNDNMIQDQTCNNIVMPVSKRRSANYQPTNLEPCFIHSKVEPTLVVYKTHFEYGGERNFKKAFFSMDVLLPEIQFELPYVSGMERLAVGHI